MSENGSWMALVEELKGIREELKGIREIIGEQGFKGHEQVNGNVERCENCVYEWRSAYDLPCINCRVAHNTETSYFVRKE